ncbi:hypothetical protein PLESTB_001256400 [Pleodorina starrii]|uniref:Uncharacterized protein n=1 Tax=Pleodorina starrii TaxID=330485 RepID=A0A9W6BTP3_9CHLO|nr:hypothetical protein PLESTM_000203500 [Pleodorina starrii]GLC57710.1 hypothetical protein PLESTB_001256400 [Pleodorina starrii]GLC63380.1 hypothetical protein PLESTF_000030200 [Pleodorina starrii]
MRRGLGRVKAGLLGRHEPRLPVQRWHGSCLSTNLYRTRVVIWTWRSWPDTVAPELLKLASPSRSSTLASLRCLSTLPVYGQSGTPADVMLGAADYQQPACYRAYRRAQATHYTAYMQRKISSAVSSLNQLLRKWEEAGPHAACTGQLPCAPHGSDGGRPATQSGPAAPPSSNADRQEVSLPADVRKRSASVASLGEPSARHACPPTSSLHPTSRASDDCGTPSGPADPVSQAEYGWDGTGESAWVPPRSAGDAGPVDSSSGPHNSSGAALVQPCGGPTPDPSVVSRRGCLILRGQQQQQHSMGTAAAAPAVAAGGTARANAGSGPGSGARPLPGRPAARPGSGGPQQPAPLHGGIDASGGGGVVPFRGGFLAQPPPCQRAETLGSNLYLRPQPGPPGAPREAPEAAGRAVSMAGNSGVGAPGHGAFVAQGGGPPQRAPPSLCNLPAPSLSIQQLVSRRGLGGGGPLGQVGRCDAANPQPQHLPQPQVAPMAPPSAQQPRQQQQDQQLVVEAATAQARGDDSSSAILGCSDLRLRAAVEATAAATAAHWQQQVAALPQMTQLYRRWSLTSLATQLAGISGSRNAAFHGSGGAYSSAAAGTGGAGGVAPLLRHTQTPLPRRRAAAQLDLGPCQGALQAVPLGALSEPLPADTCQGRSELWDLLLLNLPFAAGPGGVCGPDGVDLPSTAMETDSSGLSESIKGDRGGGANGSCAGCCCCGGGGQAGEGAVMEEQADEADAEGGQDDSDVYVCSEGLVCLASLVSTPHPSRGGWCLPFLVRPRRPSEVDEAQGAAGGGGGCRCNAARCQQSGSSPTLYFAEPLRDAPGLLADSWSRMCASALVTSRSGSGVAGGHGSGGRPAAAAANAGGSEALEEMAATVEEEEDCPCCQQDEWQLGGLSLLVLSHCDVGTAGGSHSSRGGPPAAPLPAHVVALAGASGLAGGAARQAATSAAAAAVALRYPELACRTELLSTRRTTNAATVVVVVDPGDGALLAQQCLDRGALQRLATERSAQGDCWQLVHDLLSELQRLPPGPYMLRMDAVAQSLELRGVGRGE